jgi:hypothetical protein
MTGTRIRTLLALAAIIAGVVMAIACDGEDNDITGTPCRERGARKYASNGAVFNCEYAKPGQRDSGLIWWRIQEPRKAK